MSRQRPRGLQEGSARWWRYTMKRWSNQITKGVPKNHRRRTKGGFERPAWSGTVQPYEMTYEQWCVVAAAYRRMNGLEGME